MVYRRDEGSAPSDNEPDGAPSDDGIGLRKGITEASEKSEVAALLRLLTQLANCGLDAAAKPLLHTAGSGT